MQRRVTETPPSPTNNWFRGGASESPFSIRPLVPKVRSGTPKLSRCSPTRESISGRLNYDRDAKCFINQQTGFFNILLLKVKTKKRVKVKNLFRGPDSYFAFSLLRARFSLLRARARALRQWNRSISPLNQWRRAIPFSLASQSSALFSANRKAFL